MINYKLDLYRAIDMLRLKFKISLRAYPLDAAALATRDGSAIIEYHNFKSPRFCAMALIGNRTDTIILNSARPQNAMNFDCGHELIHTFLHRETGIGQFACSSVTDRVKMQDSFMEWEANEGAAELLVPYRLLLPRLWDNQYSFRSAETYFAFRQALADEFNVTDAIMKYRIESLKYEIFQHQNGVDIDDVVFLSGRQQKEKELDVVSLNVVYGKRAPRGRYSATR